MKRTWKKTAVRGTSLTLALILALGIIVPYAVQATAGADAPPTDTSAPAPAAAEPSPAAGRVGKLNTAHGETYYATLDYYGDVLDSSVVKSYKTYGNDTIMDYGIYDGIVNLTGDIAPVIQDGTVTFQLGEDAPGQFYFEGKTKKPMEEFPWTLSLSYKLNGEPALAEDLAGEKGMVEIILDAVPNPAASEYSRNNVVLTAMSAFNGDDITSLEAEGAQVQQVGNLFCAMFMVMPGEEQHFTIRAGSNDFSYSGMVLLAVPATLDQLSQIADLREAKEKTQNSYDAIQDSMDAILDALEGMSGDINAAANGMERIDSGRETLSNGKGTIYGDTDTMRADLDSLTLLMNPMADQIEALRQTITDAKEPLNEMADIAVSLKKQLQDTERALKNLENGTDDVKDLVEGLADLEGSLRRMERALDRAGGGSSSGGQASSREQVKQVKAVHRAYEETDLEKFMVKMLLINKAADSTDMAAVMAAKLMLLIDLPREQAQAAGQLENWTTAQGLKGLYDLAQSGASFQAFCEKLPGVSREEAKRMNDLWIVYESGKVNSNTEPAPETPNSAPTPVPDDGSSGKTESTVSAARAAFRASAAEPPLLVLNTDFRGAPGLALFLSNQQDGGGDAPVPIAEADPSDQADRSESVGEAAGTSDPTSAGEGENSSVGGAAIDLIAGGLDEAMDKMNRLESELNSTISDIAGPTADVVGELADLCDELDDIADLLDDAEDLSAAIRASTGKLQSILDLVDRLRTTLNDYEPKLQETLATVSSLTSSAAQTIRDTETMIGDVENLMKSAGNDLDPGMETSLKGLIAALRKSTRALDQTDTIRDALDTVDALITGEWDSHTGENNNILLMDASAKPVSLTDPRNEGTTSIQYVMRTQEIREENEDEDSVWTEEDDNGTVWSRIAAMFRDFWQTITGWL